MATRPEANGEGPADPQVVAGRPQLLRAMNEATLLNALRRDGSLMRTDLARISGLSKPTVALGLANLERDGLVRVAGRRTGVRGPAALFYAVRPEAGYVLSLDVGGEYVRGALADLGGNVRAHGKASVHAASSQTRAAALIALADELAADAGVTRSAIAQTIVGSPGIYDRRRDALKLARGLPGWESPGVLTELRRAFGRKTLVENDVNLAALAERDRGHGRDIDAFAFVSVGTGIGMGLVLAGELRRGAHGAAGEIGFLPLGEGGGLDSSDARRRGTLEAAASAAGIVRSARRRGMRGRLSPREVFSAWAAGDLKAAEVVADEARLVARAIASIAVVADPSLVVLGGGIGCAPGFADVVAADLPSLLPVVPEIRVSALGDEVVVEGGIVAAIDLAWREILSR